MLIMIAAMPKNRTGFSLLELMVAILVILVVAAVALPQLTQAREAYRLTSTAKDLTGRLNQARVMAIARNAGHRVQVTSSSAYELQRKSTGGTWSQVESFSLPPGYTISATDAGEFHSRGNASPNGTFTITSSYSETKQIAIDLSGRVYVH